MDNLNRLSVVALATAVGMGFAAEQSPAGIIVDTMDGNAFSPRDSTFSNEPTSEQTTLVQGFTITDTSSLSSAAIRGFSEGADITIAITSMIGPGASGGDVLFEQVFSITADVFGTSIRSFNLGGLSLGAGDYFFVIMSDNAFGFEWAKVSRSGSININDRGSSTFSSGSSWYAQTYTFEEMDTDPVFTLDIEGTPIPTPGSGVLLLGVCGVCSGQSVRRKRY